MSTPLSTIEPLIDSPHALMRRKKFRGAIPNGLLYDIRTDMWVCEEGDHIVIGATSLGLFNAGEITVFVASPSGSEVAKGQCLGRAICAKTILVVPSPVSFCLLESNMEIETIPGLLNSNPYGIGWIARGHAHNWAADRAELVTAAYYRLHVLALEPDAEILSLSTGQNWST